MAAEPSQSYKQNVRIKQAKLLGTIHEAEVAYITFGHDALQQSRSLRIPQRTGIAFGQQPEVIQRDYSLAGSVGQNHRPSGGMHCSR
ncbi:hypothetical protein DSM101010T_18990 [Desulfovibrio subterraneus]|uniref:Uncharacterized protein n=1 Tax=Desulfovibrio subterraneus TaxID=2718620 RepID=A0A7J0BKE8_9BACT|nr:hypothetical protein DSM101010T_18990 [Desulfovibrio subterraneus]